MVLCEDAPPRYEDFKLDFEVDERDNVYLRHKGKPERIESIIRLLLEPVLFPLRSPEHE